MTDLLSSARFEKDWHPSEDDLLTFVDGGLMPRKASQIITHLNECWSCRAKAEKIQETISSFVDYFDRVITANMAPPPQRWQAFPAQLKHVIDECRRPWLLSRWFNSFVKPLLATPGHFRLAMAALMALLIPFLVIRFHQVSAVSANQLLQQTAKARDERIRAVPQAVIHQKLQVRRKAPASMKDSFVTWEVWNDAGKNRFSQRVEDENGSRFIHPEATNPSTGNPGQDLSSLPPILKELERIFETNQMDRHSPLSASTYGAWRRSIQRKTEQVIERKTAGGDRALAVITAAAGPFPLNAIIEAELVVRTKDWHPIEERLQVQKEQGTVYYELGEVAFDVIALNVLPPSIFADLTAPLPLPLTVTPRPLAASRELILDPAELTATEVEAWYALHSVNACLGRPVSVVQVGLSQIEVQGVVGTEEHKAQVLAALEGIPYVVPKIRTAAEDWAMTSAQSAPSGEFSSSDSQQPDATEPLSRKLAIEDLLERYFVVRSCADWQDDKSRCAQRKIAEFSQAVLTDSEAALSQAWALRQLAQWYPSLKQNELRTSTRRLLELMVRDHLNAFKKELDQTRALVRPVLSSLLGGAGIFSDTTETGLIGPLDLENGDWPAASLRFCDSVEQAMSLTLSLFAETNLRVERREEAMKDLLAVFARVDGKFQRLEAQVGTELSEGPKILTSMGKPE